jgi:hypothetical protein
MLVEMTDETNLARAFSLTPLTWATGSVVGYVLLVRVVVLWLIMHTY